MNVIYMVDKIYEEMPHFTFFKSWRIFCPNEIIPIVISEGPDNDKDETDVQKENI